MPQRRTRKAGLSSDAQTKEQHELRQKIYALFIQQVAKEAQERLNEMEAKMETLLATVDKVFELELMKMPLSLQNTHVGDLISEEISRSDVSIAMKNNSPEIHQPLKRMPSKTVRLNADSLTQTSQSQKLSWKTPKGGKGAKTIRKLVSSNSAGNLGGSTAVKRTQSRVAKISDNTATTRPRLRSVSSAGDLSCLVSGCGPHITITTSRGQISLSEETKDEINLDLFDDLALRQIQSLMRLMDYLASKVSNNE